MTEAENEQANVLMIEFGRQWGATEHSRVGECPGKDERGSSEACALEGWAARQSIQCEAQRTGCSDRGPWPPACVDNAKGQRNGLYRTERKIMRHQLFGAFYDPGTVLKNHF